eukprot:SAG31_NODE_16744_length_697_cov_45.130435_1_plen_212_part_01
MTDIDRTRRFAAARQFERLHDMAEIAATERQLAGAKQAHRRSFEAARLRTIETKTDAEMSAEITAPAAATDVTAADMEAVAAAEKIRPSKSNERPEAEYYKDAARVTEARAAAEAAEEAGERAAPATKAMNAAAASAESEAARLEEATAAAETVAREEEEQHSRTAAAAEDARVEVAKAAAEAVARAEEQHHHAAAVAEAAAAQEEAARVEE